MKLYLVGQMKWYDETETAVTWEFQGVFSTRELAVAACRDQNYFVTDEVTLDESLPHETTEPFDMFFPLRETPIKEPRL